MEEKQTNQQQIKVISPNNNNNNNNNKKLILFPIPFQGHVTPMLHLANLLHSTKSFSITIIQTRYYNPIDPTRFPHFEFHFLDDGVSTNNLVSSDNLVPGLFEMQETCREPFRVLLDRVLGSGSGSGSGSDQDRVCCLVSDALWFFAGEIAESLGLRNVVLRTSSLSAFVVNHHLPYFIEKGYFHQGVANPDEPLLEVPPFKIKDLPGEDHHDVLAAVVKHTKSSHGVICNSFDELESSSITKVRQILSIPVFPIGPLHKHSPSSTSSTIWTQDRTSISWLDTQPPYSVLYVSFGSLATINPTDFLEIAWGLANSGQPFLWVVRPGMSQNVQDSSGFGSGSLFPEGYLEIVKDRAHIVEWAPQVEILAHQAVGGFWTHCGWNSTIESISEGVPMLCLPFFVDQAMNARNVSEYWKVGLVLENGIRRDKIETGIRKLMVGEEGEAMRSRATSLKECAKQCLMEGGSSSTSLEALISHLLAS